MAAATAPRDVSVGPGRGWLPRPRKRLLLDPRDQLGAKAGTTHDLPDSKPAKTHLLREPRVLQQAPGAQRHAVGPTCQDVQGSGLLVPGVYLQCQGDVLLDDEDLKPDLGHAPAHTVGLSTSGVSSDRGPGQRTDCLLGCAQDKLVTGHG